MRALIVTLRFDEPGPGAEARIEAIARALASVEGLLSTNWLRSGGRIALVQTFASHRALDAFLDGELFAGLSRLPGCRDVYAAQYEISTRLNALTILGEPEDARALERDLVPA